MMSRTEDVGNYYLDNMLHKMFTKILCEYCDCNCSHIKEILRNEDFIISILEKNPVFRRQLPIKTSEKISLLWILILARYEKSAELLIRYGADVNEEHMKSTILQVLFRLEHSSEYERLIRLLVDHGADLQARDYIGQTVLHYAIKYGRVQMTEMLLEKGANINAVDDQGMTPLLLAADSVKANELVPLLMKYGANIFCEDKNNMNVLHYLAFSDHEDQHVNLARVFIEKGVSLDRASSDCRLPYPPIHWAADGGCNELVKLFLDHGANVDQRATDGKFPLYLVAGCHRFSIKSSARTAVLKTLLTRGADVNLRTTDDRRTALHIACEHNHVEHVRLLLLAGANPLVEDHLGMTPFALISTNGDDLSIYQMIIKLLALKKLSQPSIELTDESIINRCSRLQEYYAECRVHASRMQFTRFIKDCTFLELLTESRCRIATFMRNPNFEANIKLYNLSEFSMYTEDIIRALELAQDHYCDILQQENVIIEAFYNTLPDLVVDKVVGYIFDCCEGAKSKK